MRRFLSIFGIAAAVAVVAAACHPGPGAHVEGVFWDQQDIDAINTDSAAYQRVRSVAFGSWAAPSFAQNEHDADVQTLAGAIVANKEQNLVLRNKVIEQLDRLPSAPTYRALEAARNTGAYAVAADLIGFRGSEAAGLRSFFINHINRSTQQGHGDCGTSLRATARCSSNNWGSMARFAVGAVEAYLGDANPYNFLYDVVQPWAHYTGENRDSNDPLNYDSTDWACPGDRAGINPDCDPGALDKNGGLPEELRRSGGYTPPPGPNQNYVQGATQANVAAAIVIDRFTNNGAHIYGFDAVNRSMNFIYNRMRIPPEGNDAWLVHAWNAYRQVSWGERPLDKHGKIMDYTDAVQVTRVR